VSTGAGFNSKETRHPVCSPTPEILTGLRIVFCILSS
jgi:hypothetical protein